MHLDFTINIPVILSIAALFWGMVVNHFTNKETINTLKESISNLKKLISEHQKCINILERDNHWMRNFITKMASKLLPDDEYFNIIKDVDSYIDRFHRKGE